MAYEDYFGQLFVFCIFGPWRVVYYTVALIYWVVIAEPINFFKTLCVWPSGAHLLFLQGLIFEAEVALVVLNFLFTSWIDYWQSIFLCIVWFFLPPILYIIFILTYSKYWRKVANEKCGASLLFLFFLLFPFPIMILFTVFACITNYSLVPWIRRAIIRGWDYALDYCSLEPTRERTFEMEIFAVNCQSLSILLGRSIPFFTTVLADFVAFPPGYFVSEDPKDQAYLSRQKNIMIAALAISILSILSSIQILWRGLKYNRFGLKPVTGLSADDYKLSFPVTLLPSSRSKAVTLLPWSSSASEKKPIRTPPKLSKRVSEGEMLFKEKTAGEEEAETSSNPKATTTSLMSATPLATLGAPLGTEVLLPIAYPDMTNGDAGDALFEKWANRFEQLRRFLLLNQPDLPNPEMEALGMLQDFTFHDLVGSLRKRYADAPLPRGWEDELHPDHEPDASFIPDSIIARLRSLPQSTPLATAIAV